MKKRILKTIIHCGSSNRKKAHALHRSNSKRVQKVSVGLVSHRVVYSELREV